jgi:hypothetical protein
MTKRTNNDILNKIKIPHLLHHLVLYTLVVGFSKTTRAPASPSVRSVPRCEWYQCVPGGYALNLSEKIMHIY